VRGLKAAGCDFTREKVVDAINQITDWKNQLLAKAADVFGGEPRPDEPTSTSRCCTPRSANWHWRMIF